LENGQDYAQGVALYESHGSSQVVLTTLRYGATEFNRQKLRKELSSINEVVTTPAAPVRVPQAPRPRPVVAEPAPVNEALRAQRSSWYAERHRLHATLELLATDEERRVAGERICEISELLTASYQAAGEAPVAAPRPDLSGVSDEGTIRRLLANLRPQASKLKKKPARALDLQQVRADIELLEKKLKP
jgi:hypothetical protein